MTELHSHMRRDEALRRLTLTQLQALRSPSARRKARTQIPPLLPQERGPTVPLSYAQERLWFIDQLGLSGSAYNVSVILRVEGALSVAALERSLEELIRRQESLRTRFESIDGTPIQVIDPPGPYCLGLSDLSQLSDTDRALELARRGREEAQRTFDLAKGPLFRASLLKLRPREHVLLMTLHHIVSDGWSLGVLTRELGSLYRAWREGRVAPLPDPPLQYADYSIWQRGWLQGSELEARLRHWKERLEGLQPLQLPADRARPAVSSFRGGTVPFELNATASARLIEVGREHGATLYMVVLAAFQVLLGRYCRQDDVVVGSPIAGRKYQELEGLIGFFVNTLVMRTDLSGNPTFRELLERVKTGALEAYSQQDLPFEKLVIELRPERNLASQPLFQVLLTLQNFPRQKLELAGLTWTSMETEHVTAKFDLAVGLEEGPEGLSGVFEYASDLFDRGTIVTMAEHFRVLLAGIAADPQCRIQDLPLLGEAERQLVVADWNRTATSYPRHRAIQAVFEESVRNRPEAIAVVGDGWSWTYAELNARANQLARYLVAQGVRIGEYVPLLMQRGPDMLVAQLATLKAGATYVPLDPEFPAERQAFILKDSGARTVLTDRNCSLTPDRTSLRYIDISDVAEPLARLSCDDLELASESVPPAYVMYTSGSSGTPKGVIVPHHAVNRLAINNGYARIDPQDRIAHCSNPAFDASTFEVWAALLNGASVVLVPQPVVLDPVRFATLLHEQRVTVLWMTAGLFGQYATALARVFPQLRYLLVGGDVVDPNAVRRVLREWPPLHLVNGYGPTECTTFSATHLVATVPDNARSIPIGRPIANTRIYILDRQRSPVPVGAVGEIYIGGDAVACGYLNQPELTRERFVVDPFSSDPAARLYRSGDLGRWRVDGTIEFLGREDSQIKLRGYRVEVGEIEAQLLQHPHVTEATVTVHDSGSGDKRLIGYVSVDVPELKRLSVESGQSKLIGQWQSLYEQTYSTEVYGPSFVGWNSSYTGQAIPEEQMREWLDSTVARIRALRPRRVLEIGCGVGLLLQHLAPSCEVYRGIDFSASAIDRLRRWVGTRPDLQHVQLHRCSALELESESTVYDTVILNSVIQYFPGVEYLLRTLRLAVGRVTAGGHLFVGDVRHLGLLRTFHSSVQLDKVVAGASIGSLRRRIAQAVDRDKELVVAPRLFTELPGCLERISDVRVLVKRGNHDNELNKYRYDVVIDVEAGARASRAEEIDWQAQALSLVDISSRLTSTRPRALRISGVENRRLYRDLAVERLVAESDEAHGAQFLWRSLSDVSVRGEDPEAFWAIGDESGYETRVLLRPGHDDGSFDVEFVDPSHEPEGLASEASAHRMMRLLSEGWPDTYVTDPWKRNLQQQMIPTLREYIENRLPPFMIPSAFVVLDRLPLTKNGKVDRRALPPPDFEAYSSREYEVPLGRIETVVADIWRELLRLERVGRQDNFFELGGHSLLAVSVVERLRREGLRTDVRTLFANPSLSGLAAAVGDGTVAEVPPNRIPAGCQRIEPQMLPLVSLTQEEIERIVSTVSGGAANVQDIYPLAPLQEGILFHHLLSTRGDPYVLSVMFGFDTRARLERYVEALQSVMDRHDILRTAVVWEGVREPIQVVWRQARVQVEEIALSGCGEAGRELLERCNPRQTRIDVRRAPMMRFFIARDAVARDGVGERWLLLWLHHHLLMDHMTLKVLQREIEAHLSGRGQELPPPLAFRHFVAQARLGVSAQEHERYFKQLLADVYESTAPFGLLDVQAEGEGIREAHRGVPASVGRRLREQARKLGVSAASVCHLAWAQVLARVSAREDVVFGTVLFGRMQGGEGAERVMGLLINALPVRIKVGEESVQSSVRGTHAQLTQLIRHEHASLALAQRCSGVVAPTPLFSALLNYRHSAQGPSGEPPGGTLEGGKALEGIEALHAQERTNYPLALAVDDFGESGFELRAQAQEPIDPQLVCDLMNAALERLVGALESAPGTASASVDVLPQSQREQVLVEWNATETPYPREKCIHELFEEQVERTPGAVAVVYEEERLTYAELNARANGLAHHLRGLGVGPDDLVGVCLERSLEQVVGILAVLKAGGAYVPLDPSYPPARLRYMLEDAVPKVVLSHAPVLQGAAGAWLRDLGGPAPLIDLSQHASQWGQGHPDRQSNPDRHSSLTPTHLAYVIYTSGSTGQPKGVGGTQRGLVNRVVAQQYIAPFDENDVCCQKTSVAFVDSVFEILGPLCAGRPLVVASRQVCHDVEALALLIQKERITRLVSVPSLARALLRSGVRLASLRGWTLSGEELDTSLLEELRRNLPECASINLYGSSEVAADVTCFAGDRFTGGRVPIGRPIANCRVYILDARRRPVPVGVVGDIYVAGAGVARGYLNRADLTAERFVKDPFDADASARMYRTGDLGRWRSDGEIEYLGRTDQQVKIRGYRIEVGEIEGQLQRHPQVKEAVVLASEGDTGEQHLVAYYTSRGEALEVESLRAHLKSVLPEYMVPAVYVNLERLPLTPNGKLDRKALPAPEMEARDRRPYEAPRGDVEEILAGIWAQLLKLERVGRSDHFFQLGGHSLLIVQLLERLQRVGLSTQVRRVFENPRLAELAGALFASCAAEVDVETLIPQGCEAITPQMLPLVRLEPEHIERIVETVPGGAQNIQDIYPLAPLQEGLLFHHLLDERGGRTYVLSVVVSAGSRQRLQELLASLQWVIDRHDVLRTAVLWEGLPEAVQVVYRHVSLPIEERSLDPGRDVLEQMQEDAPEQPGLELGVAPLMKADIAADPHDGRWYVKLRLHHLICDRLSFGLIFSEAAAHLQGNGQKLSQPVPYRNHVARTLSYGRTQDVEKFFRAKLGDVEEPTAPFGLLDVHGKGSRIEQAQEPLEEELARAVRMQARRLGVSAAALVHTAWALVVARTSATDDAVFGTVLLGRMYGSSDAPRMMGMFINTLPLRIRLQGVGARELVERVQRELVELLAHEQASLALALRCSGIGRKRPLFTALLNYRHNSSQAQLGSDELDVRVLGSQERTNYPVTLSVDDLGEGFALTVQTDRRIDPRRVAGYMREAVRSLVHALEHAPRTPVEGLSILSEAERRQVLELFNATEAPYPKDKCVHEVFEEQVERTPDAVAVVYEGESLTYWQLNGRANQLAHYLRAQGMSGGEYVAIVMPRCLQLLIAQLAVLKNAAAYVPLDPSHPVERLVWLLRDSGARYVLTDDEGIERLESAIPSDCGEWLNVDRVRDQIERCVRSNPDIPRSATAPAYVMYTSGSTGTPKGVVVPHRAVSRLVINNGYADITPSDCVAHCSNPAFDAATFEVWGALLTGARLCVVPQVLVMEPRRLSERLAEEEVTVLWLTVGLFNQYSDPLADVFRRLRHLLVGGDVLDPHTIRRVLRQSPPQRLLNGYGPTECTTFSATHLIERLADEERSVPLGRPISNTRIYILDGHGALLPVGVPGEIYIGGAGVACGYLNQPRLTAERFVKDPFSTEPDARMYRTGDLGRWRADGCLEYLGRNDFQVKVRGFRVELGEIESRLCQCPGVREAVVLAREDSTGDKRLVAYYTSRGATPEVECLREHLERVLPDYMVPTAYVGLERLPLTLNGKVDRKALRAPQRDDSRCDAYEAPKGPVEEILAGIWRELLSLETVSRHEDFFELGGHSLLAVKAVTAIRKRCGGLVTLADFYKGPTVRELAGRIRVGASSDPFVDVVAEAQLEDPIRGVTGSEAVSGRTVLLTGATGLVGRFLLSELLRETNANVYCAVRGAAPQSLSRVKDTLIKWDLWNEQFEDRLIPVACDLGLPRLGLNTEDFERLGRRIDTIYHCATSMNHLETYASAKAVNVAGTRELLELVSSGRPKLLNYISTLSVFSRRGDGSARTVDEMSCVDHQQHRFSEGYSASKCVAEKLVSVARERGIAANIFRLGLVWPDTRAGRYDALQREYRVFKSCYLSGLGIQNYGYDVDPVPVDYVARAILRLSRRHIEGGGVFHISSSSRTARDLFERCNRITASPLELLPLYDWIQRIKKLHDDGRSLPVVPLVEFAFHMDREEFERAEPGPVHIECARTQAELERAGIATPVFNDEQLRAYLECLFARDDELNCRRTQP